MNKFTDSEIKLFAYEFQRFNFDCNYWSPSTLIVRLVDCYKYCITIHKNVNNMYYFYIYRKSLSKGFYANCSSFSKLLCTRDAYETPYDLVNDVKNFQNVMIENKIDINESKKNIFQLLQNIEKYCNNVKIKSDEKSISLHTSKFEHVESELCKIQMYILNEF